MIRIPYKVFHLSGRWSVINTETYALQSSWSTSKSAAECAQSLNNSLAKARSRQAWSDRMKAKQNKEPQKLRLVK